MLEGGKRQDLIRAIAGWPATQTETKVKSRFPNLLAPLASIATVSPARIESRMKPSLQAGFKMKT